MEGAAKKSVAIDEKKNQYHGATDELVWVSHPEEIWVKGKIVSEDGDMFTVHLQSTPGMKGEGRQKVSKKDIYIVNRSSAEDMTSLHHLHEPGILANLGERYVNDYIYTYMGAAMIAVNPYKKITEPKMSEYMSSKSGVAPHPFTISENCYKNLNVLKKCQSIIISGESGAGKTETAKIVIKYLAERNRLAASNAISRSSNDPSYQLYEKLIQMSPILESFGNAKTSRNSNSSRFGKFLKLLYNPPASVNKSESNLMELYGAMIETYLLEKSRVVYQNEGEQNFHIFYSLLESPPATCQLDSRYQFRIAKKTNPASSGILDPSHRLDAVAEAFVTLGIRQEQIEGIWKILAALLYLGNITFDNFDSPEGPIAKISAIPDQANSSLSSMNCLKLAADLLAVDLNSLKNVLTQREVETRGEKFQVSLTVREASFARDATIKAIYESLFTFIVKLINRSITRSDFQQSTTSESFIGVLDIFGFESFEKNGFEQLLINYANEALQNTFNKQIFEKEIQLFEEEKIEISIGDCPSNLKCVELISAKNESIFSTLDTISRQPQPSDERFCEELHKAFTKKNVYFGSVHRKDMKNLFIVQHYATSVRYTVGNAAVNLTSGSNENQNQDTAWISKNNDAIPDGLESLFQQSSLPEFRALGVIQDNGTGKQEPRRRKSVMMKPTIVATFGKSMLELNEMLEVTSCHFIRCIKPNAIAKPNQFQVGYVVEQIRALGILQACEILSVSLPTRITYFDLKNALSSVIAKILPKFPMLSTEEGNVLLIATILRAYQVPEDAYRLGVTIAFFKPGQLAFIDRILNTSYDTVTEQAIVKTIESAIQQYTTITTDISKMSNQIQIAVEFIRELEKRQDRLRNHVNILPENQGLDLPEDLSRQLGELESKFSLLQSRRKESVIKHRLKLESLMSSKGIDKAKLEGNGSDYDRMYDQAIQWIRWTHEMEDVNYRDLHEKYDLIHQTIESLEESTNKKIDPALLAQVEKNDTIYEEIMEGVSKVEQLMTEVKLLAQRCRIDAAYAMYSGINEEIISVNQKTKDLSEGIEVANQALQNYEDSVNNVNFSDLEKKIVATYRFFQDLGSLLQRGEEQFQKIYSEINNFSYNIKAPTPTPKPPPPPPPSQRPSITGSSASSISTSPVTSSVTPPEKPKKPSRDGENVRGSISYNIKDLAALRKRGSTTSGADETSTLSKTVSTNSVDIDDASSLPPDWKELFDPKSQRPYYVNKVTKQKQWQKPTASTISSISAGDAETDSQRDDKETGKSRSERVRSVRLQSTGQLPPDWREVIDKKSGRPYYVNDVTKERQWRRPEAIITTTDVSPNKIESIDRVSRRISKKISVNLIHEGSTLNISSLGGKVKGSVISDERVSRARRTSALILSEELTSEEALSEEMKQTVSFLCRAGNQMKSGYLQKQSKLLQRWRKRFFVLNEQKLFYFDSEKEYLQAMKNFKNNPNLSLKAEKQFLLSSKTQVSYTTTDNCFSLINPPDSNNNGSSKEKVDGGEDSWYLLADSEDLQEEWMKALNGHVHVLYLRENKLSGKDFWDEGSVSLTLWKVPSPNSANTVRRPVGIRSVPNVDGPRTGEGLFAGDIVEVVQTIEDSNSNQRYLRLADDRGWVFENHPTANYAIMTPVGGKVVEIIHTYEYPSEFLEPLAVFSSPRCSSDFVTELVFSPGSRLQTSAEWTVSSDLLGEHDDDEDSISFCFLKLREHRGWVQMYHPVTGGKLLKLIE